MKKLVAVIAVLVVLAVGFLGFQGYERSKQKELFADASVFFEEEDYQKAIQLFEEASEYNNLFSGSLKEQFLYYQAEAYMNLGEYEEAVEIYDQFIAKKPKEERNYILKGYCYGQSGEYEKAEAVYEEGFQQTGDGEFLLNLCNTYLATEEYDKALELIEENRDVDSEDTARELLFSEIVIYEKQQEYEKAYEKAKEFVEVYPDDEDGQKELTFLESRQ
jgi:tetratricopeptide (TPR) repeat protein